MLLYVLPALHAAPAGGGGFDPLSMMPLLLVFVVMYFLWIRPQQRKDKEHQEMLNGITVGQSVLLQSGILGKVALIVDEKELLIEIAPDVSVRCLKRAVASIVPKEVPKKVKKALGASPTGRNKGISKKVANS